MKLFHKLFDMLTGMLPYIYLFVYNVCVTIHVMFTKWFENGSILLTLISYLLKKLRDLLLRR